MEEVLIEERITFIEEGTNNQAKTEGLASNIKYIFFGMFFGIILVKAEVVSWFRIQEMFRLQSFHMYGVIGTAVFVAAICTYLIKRFKIKTITGEEVVFRDQPFHKGNIFGGLIFGFGWALTGACPGPIYALIGSGYFPFIVVLASALLGTYTYGIIRDRLPH
jgi:uncharacterized membrane protein YedE/YeeE